MTKQTPFLWNPNDEYNELPEILATLPALDAEKTRWLRGQLYDAFFKYAEKRHAIDAYHNRNDANKMISRICETFEEANSKLGRSQSCHEYSDRECLEEALGIFRLEEIAPPEKRGPVWDWPVFDEIVRRVLNSHREDLRRINTNPFVGKKPPARHDKSPERELVGSLLAVFADIHGIEVAAVRIGNDRDRNPFLRFAMSVTDHVIEGPDSAKSAVAVGGHARTVRAAMREIRS